MKGLLTAAAFAVFAVPAAAQHVTDNVDRFTGEREIAYTASGSPPPGQPIVTIRTFVSQGETKVLASFTIFPKLNEYARQEFAYLRCHSVNWLVDGKPLAAGVVVYDFERYRRILMEKISQEIPVPALQAIGAARSVEFRICNDEFRLTPEDIAAAKIIAQKLQGGSAP